MKFLPLLALSSCCLVTVPVCAQPSSATAVSTSAQNPSRIGPSLQAHLQLKAAQITKLNALYDQWLTKRGSFEIVQQRAWKILTPLQRAQLDSIANDARLRIRDDQYSQLLLPHDYQSGSSGYENQRRDNHRENSRTEKRRSKPQRQRRNNGNGSYGVYGGYGYGGPNYGVYGNYGQGNVGVSGTIGRYGPSIGINVGRVFGGRWLR